MATGFSPDFINKNITTLSQVFQNVDQHIIYIVLQQCQFDFTKASTILAALNVQNSSHQNDLRSISSYRGDNSLLRHNEEPISPYNGTIGFIKQGCKVVVLIRGLPGSGKSTLATELLKSSLGNVNKDEFIFSAAQYFSDSDTHIYNSKEVDKAYQWNQKRCFLQMRKGVSPIIIDEPNFQTEDMKVYCVMAVKFGYIVEIVAPLTPWALKPKILAGKNNHGVTKREIKAMLEYFQQNVTVKDLFREFGLEYVDRMPQFRKYPPLVTSQVNVDLSNWDDEGKTGLGEYGIPENRKSDFQKGNKTSSAKKQSTDADKANSRAKLEAPNFNSPPLSTEKPLSAPDKNVALDEFDSEVNDFMRKCGNGDSENKSMAQEILTKKLPKRSNSMIHEDNRGIFKELFSKLSSEDNEEVKKLRNLFPNVPLGILLDSYLKCSKNLFQTVDLVRQSPEFLASIENPKRKDQSKNLEQQKSYALNELNVNFSDNVRRIPVVGEELKQKLEKYYADNFQELKNEQPSGAHVNKEEILSETMLSSKIESNLGCMTDEEVLLKLNHEEREDFKNLRIIFPHIPVEDLLDVYENCNKDMTWSADLLVSFTVENLKKNGSKKSQKTASTKENNSRCSLQSENASGNVMPRQQNATERRCNSPGFITFDDDSIYMSDSNSDCDSEHEETNDLVELNLGKELVLQLENMFGQFVYGENIKPMVQMPKSLARQLHALYLESISRQTESQSEYISSQLKEDEEFTIELRQEERSISGSSTSRNADESLDMNSYRKDQWENTTPDTLALKLTRKKLHAVFPQIEYQLLDEILTAHNNNYTQTVEVVTNTIETPPLPSCSNEDPLKQPISDDVLNEMRTQNLIVNQINDEDDGTVKSAASYRDEANMHIKRRRELLQLAQEQQQKHSGEVAMFYRHLAYVELKKAEVSNQYAIHRFAEENAEKLQKSDTLDLYFHYVKDAIVTLDIFIDYQISNLKRVHKSCDYYFVITGRGKISEHGKSKLRAAVVKRLKQRKIGFTSVNPGMLQIEVQKKSLMSTDLEKR